MEQKLKDSDAILDFEFDFAGLTNGRVGVDADWLDADETIASLTVTSLDTGINLHDGVTEYDGATKPAPVQANANTSVVFWVSGGTAGDKYRFTCEIVTSAGRTDQRTITIKAVNR